MTTEQKLIEYKFEYQWGGEDTWFTKANRWAQKQKFPINHLAIGLIAWLWVKWVDGKVQMTMADIDKQVKHIGEIWDEEDKKNNQPVIKTEPSEVEGLNIIEIKSPWSDNGNT